MVVILLYLSYLYIYIYIWYIYSIQNYTRRPGCCQAVYHGTNPLGFVKVCLCQFFFFFTTLLMSDLGFRVYDVVCLETSLDSQVAMSPDIPTCKKHWPCAVEIDFGGQHPHPGRNYIIYIYIYHISYFVYIYTYPVVRRELRSYGYSYSLLNGELRSYQEFSQPPTRYIHTLHKLCTLYALII